MVFEQKQILNIIKGFNLPKDEMIGPKVDEIFFEKARKVTSVGTIVTRKNGVLEQKTENGWIRLKKEKGVSSQDEKGGSSDISKKTVELPKVIPNMYNSSSNAKTESKESHEKRGFDEGKGDEDVTGKNENIPKDNNKKKDDVKDSKKMYLNI